MTSGPGESSSPSWAEGGDATIAFGDQHGRPREKMETMPNQQTFLIVGASLAGAKAAE